MAGLKETGRVDLRTLDFSRIAAVIGVDINNLLEIGGVEAVAPELSPLFLQGERLIAQAAEISLIAADATAIEGIFQEKELPLPSAYAIFTAGFPVPREASLLGEYGKGPFEGFARPAIKGHAGEVYAMRLGDRTAMILSGRAHPTEWSNERFGSMIVAHPLRVVQELIRRQRARDGINPPVVLTYLTGVAADYPMKPGGLAVILDDMELANVLHPGHGPIELLDEWIGDHFQPKMGRASDPELAKIFLEVARGKNIGLYPVAACGTPGATEFQSMLEYALIEKAFQDAKRMGLDEIAKEIFGPADSSLLSPLFCMGITFELATLRQIHRDKGEADFRVLALGLATDVVGGTQSRTIDHGTVVKEALSTGERNLALMTQFLERAFQDPSFLQADQVDHSISYRLDQLKKASKGVVEKRGSSRER